MSNIAPLLKSAGRLYDRLIACAGGRQIFLVGGSVRDALIGRRATDFDFAVSGSGLEFAGQFARQARGKFIILSEPDDEARVVCGDLCFDFNGFGSRTIESDILRRDFTINALAVELTARCSCVAAGNPDAGIRNQDLRSRNSVGSVVDLVGGQHDIERRLIRPVSPTSLALDPLRLLRAVRLALELGFSIDESVFEQGRRITLSATAAERSGAEFLRITDSPGSLPLVRKLLDVGRLADILPELAALLDDKQLREHSLRTYQKVEEIIASPGFFAAVEPEWTTYFDRWGVETLDPETATTEQPLPFRRGLLKLAGLLHDIAKPETRFTNTEGEVHFYGHDSLGARTVGRLARERLRLSRAQSEMLTTLTAEHMRLHLLATSRELTDRAVRRFWSDLGTEALGLMVLCVADGWATAGRTAHLEDTIARMVAQKRTEDAVRRIRRLVTGDDLIALGLTPGPVFKVILQELEDLQIEGRITTKEDGIAYLKTHLAAQSGPGLR